MRIVLAVRDRIGFGSVVSALETGEELRRLGHLVVHDEGDYDQAWDRAEVALVHPDDPARLLRLRKQYRVPLVLLARHPDDMTAFDPAALRMVAKPSLSGLLTPTALPVLRVPPLAPTLFWAVCPHRDPDCLCVRTGVCKYVDDPQTNYHAPAPPPAPTAITLVGCSSRHGAGVVFDIARQLPDRDFVIVRTGRADLAAPNIPNVEVVGPCDRADLRRVYARTRLLLMPGTQTAGRPALEAGASHIPTVAHPSPGASETLGRGAVWVPVERRQDWLSQIVALDNVNRYRNAAAAAFWKAGAGYTLRAQAVAELAAALQELTGAKAA